MSTSLLILALLAQPAGEPTSQPAVPSSQPAALAPAGPEGSAKDVTAELTVIYELGERVLRTQESWNLRNASGRTVPPSGLEIVMPPGTKKLRLDEGAVGSRAAEDSSKIIGEKALGQEDRAIAGTYELGFSGSSMVMRRVLPFGTRARVIMEAIPGLTLAANVEPTKRERELNGIQFFIWDFPPIEPGRELELRFSGLPSKSVWPQRAALFAAFLIILWAVFALRGAKVPGADPALAIGPLTGAARRDRLVKAIEILERDFKAERVNEKQYARRREALIEELAVVLREIDLEGQRARPGAPGNVQG